MTDKVAYLLDTNVVSETRRVRPHHGVVAFLESVDSARLFVSALTLGELRRGVEIKRRTDSLGAELIASWVDGIEITFADRVLPIDGPVARMWGELSADRKRPVIDTLLAASAIVHGLILVTRNSADVSGIDVPLANPWRETPQN